MKPNLLLALSLPSLDVLNAQGASSLVNPNETDTKTTAYISGRALDARSQDGRRRRIAARKRQPQGQDSDEGLSSGADEGISSGAITGIVVGSSALVGCVILCWPRSTTPGTTTPGTTTSSTTAETIGAAEIQI